MALSDQPDPTQGHNSTHDNATFDENVIEAASSVDNDSDSNYESGIEDDATSISSSVTDYVFENGRRYTSFRDAKWVLPNDEEEQDRMDLHHHVFLLRMDGQLLRAPIGEHPQRILDIGTGTGIWAIDMADQYPSAQIVGTDLSPIQPAWVPPNCQFEVDNAEDEWTFEKNSFDLIHVRNLSGIKDWRKLIRQCYEHLKPGGYLELHEVPSQFLTDDESLPANSNFKEMITKFYEAADKVGLNFLETYQLKGYMENSGFKEMDQKVLKLPLGTWPKNAKLKEIGKYNLANIYAAIPAYCMALFTRVLGMSGEEADRIVEGAKADILNKSIHLYMPVFLIYGRKPL